MRIVLAHGVLGFSVLGPFEYFNGVKRHLESRHHAQVFAAQVPPIGSVADRGKKLGHKILETFPSGEPVHILAHSMGGLDARWALRKVQGLAARVKTLVAIGTPHRGSPVADAIRGGSTSGIPLPILDELRHNQLALRDLATDHREEPDVDGVTYRYVVGNLSLPNAHCSLPFRAIQTIFGVPADSDGVVTVSSATRGGSVNADLQWPVDHAGEIGWNLDRPFVDTSHLARYDDIIALLSRTEDGSDE